MFNFLDIAVPEEPTSTFTINPIITISILVVLFIAIALITVKVKKK